MIPEIEKIVLYDESFDIGTDELADSDKKYFKKFSELGEKIGLPLDEKFAESIKKRKRYFKDKGLIHEDDKEEVLTLGMSAFIVGYNRSDRHYRPLLDNPKLNSLEEYVRSRLEPDMLVVAGKMYEGGVDFKVRYTPKTKDKLVGVVEYLIEQNPNIKVEDRSGFYILHKGLK